MSGEGRKMNDEIKREWIEAIDVYSQYFHASCPFEGSLRKAALVKLTVLKDENREHSYQVSASFMPYEDEEDFRVPDDLRVSRIVYSGTKRRVKKKEEEFLNEIREKIDVLLPQMGSDAVIFWDRPLREARFG